MNKYDSYLTFLSSVTQITVIVFILSIEYTGYYVKISEHINVGNLFSSEEKLIWKVCVQGACE